MYAKIFILVYSQVPENRSGKFRFLILVPKMQLTVRITSSPSPRERLLETITTKFCIWPEKWLPPHHVQNSG